VSRFGDACSMAAMLLFCQELALRSLNRVIEKVFYDEKFCLCHVQVMGSYPQHSSIIDEVIECGEKTLPQFEIHAEGHEKDGFVFHGPGVEE